MRHLSNLIIFVIISLCFIVSAGANEMITGSLDPAVNSEDLPFPHVSVHADGMRVGITGSGSDDSNGFVDILSATQGYPVLSDIDPDIIWQRCLGGSGGDCATSMKKISNGGYILAGSSDSDDGDVTGLHSSESNGSDYWVVQLSGTGELIWEKCLGGSNDDQATSVIETSDGGYVVAGFTTSDDGEVTGFHHGDESYYADYWVVQLSGTGELIWEKCLGGSGDDHATSVIETSDGGYIVAGFTTSDDGDVSGFHKGEYPTDGDYWVVKLSGNGELIWEKCLGGSGNDYAESIITTDDGGYILAGGTQSDDDDVTGNHGITDYWVVKISGTGELIWEKCFGGSDADVPYDIIQTGDGGFIVAGTTISRDGDITSPHGNFDYWVVKLSGAGDIIWEKCLGGSAAEEAYSISGTNDGYIIAGYSDSIDGDVSEHDYGGCYWIVKLSGAGELIWEKCLGGKSTVTGYAITRAYGVYGLYGDRYIVGGFTRADAGDVIGNHGSADYWVVEFTMVPVPIASFITDPVSGPAPLTVLFTDTSTGSPTSWDWAFGDGSTSTIQNPSYEFADPGSYDVSLTVSHAQGSDTSHATVTVEDPGSSINLTLQSGWNLVSVPQYPIRDQDTLEKLFGSVSSAGHSISMYNASAQAWEVPLPAHQVTPLEAYFVYSIEKACILVSYASDQPEPETMLYPTWNQIGYCGITAEETQSYLSSLGDAWTFVSGYNASDQEYEETIIRGGTGPYSDCRPLEPGRGYWLYCEEEMVFHPFFDQ
ncbi:MAG: PKD domain-containing protein [Methanospirillaceae archaeon]|nr:PKD domain-containing protein [Methanospirillaceae archaeon]